MNKEKDILYFILFWQDWIFLKNLFLKTHFVGSCGFITEARTLIAMYIWLQSIPLIIEDNRTFDMFWIGRSACEIWEEEKSSKHSFMYYDYLVTVLLLQDWKRWKRRVFPKSLFSIVIAKRVNCVVLQQMVLYMIFSGIPCSKVSLTSANTVQCFCFISFNLFQSTARDTEKRCK